jgi:hypothetical protein
VPRSASISSSSPRRRFLVALAAWLGGRRSPGATQSIDARHLADYRLTPEVFKRFAHATRLIAAITQRDVRFHDQPLITREISVSGDAPAMAAALKQRLDTEPALAEALFAADISAHEYAVFAIALFAARLAQGFLRSGAMRRVPPGAATENVAFVATHEVEIVALLKQLNLE